MKKVFWLIVLILIGSGVALWWYIRKDNNMYRLVPKDAHMVMSLSLPSLLNEISTDELKNINLMDRVKDELHGMRDTAAFERIKKLRDSGSNFGVDLFSDVVFFKSRYEGLDFYGLVFDIADPAEFRKVLTALDPGFIIDMKANYSVMDLSDGTFLAWNKRGGIVVHNDYSYAYARKIIRSNFIVETFSRSEDESIIAVPQFQTNKDNGYLVSVFINYAAMDTAKVRVYDDGEVLQKPDNLWSFAQLKDSYLAGGLKHTNQELIFEGKMISFVTGEPLFGQYVGNGLSDNHARVIAAADPIFVLGCAQRKDASIDSLLATPEYQEGFNELEQKIGLSKSDVQSIFNSEFSVAFQGVSKIPFDPKTDVVPYDRSMMTSDENGNMYVKKWTFSANIINADKLLLHKLMDGLVDHYELCERDGQDWKLNAGLFSAQIVDMPLGLHITNNTGNIASVKTGQLGVMSDGVMNGLLQNQFFAQLNADKATYNPDTQEAMDKLGESFMPGNVVMNQIVGMSMIYTNAKFEMKLKLKNGEEKLINRILKIVNDINNPVVS